MRRIEGISRFPATLNDPMELASRRFSKTTIDRHRLFPQKGSNRNRLAAGVV